MTDSSLCFLTDIPARDIWHPTIGHSLLAAIQDKTRQTLQDDEQGQLIDVEQQWQLYSSKDHEFNTENAARQYFFELAQQQQQLQEYLSTQRCLFIVETLEKWRLWQLIKIEKSLADRLTTAITQDSNKKIAALLLISMEKFLLASQQFAQLNFYPDLTLETLTLQNNKPIFLGFIATNTKTADHDLKHAFTSIFIQILKLPKENIREILQYLELYASSHKDNELLLNSLQVLLSV